MLNILFGDVWAWDGRMHTSEHGIDAIKLKPQTVDLSFPRRRESHLESQTVQKMGFPPARE